MTGENSSAPTPAGDVDVEETLLPGDMVSVKAFQKTLWSSRCFEQGGDIEVGKFCLKRLAIVVAVDARAEVLIMTDDACGWTWTNGLRKENC